MSFQKHLLALASGMLCAFAVHAADPINTATQQSSTQQTNTQQTATIASTPSQDSGPIRPYIVGGEESVPGSRPWMVSLQRGSHFCGGSLIKNDWVLTAAHCVDGSSPTGLRAVIGRHDLNTSTGQSITVSQIIVHPSYNDSTSDNDIALLKLSSPTTLNPTLMQIPDIDLMNEAAAPGDMVITAGWGTTSEGGSLATRLREVAVPVVSNTTCNAPASYNGSITANMICAGYAAGGKDSCQGDSGGPLMFTYAGADYQAGVVSFGEGCARANKYGVYTRVVNYGTWINEQINGTPPTGTVLEKGVPKTGLSGASGAQTLYTMNVPAGASGLKFTMSGGSGDADMYVRFGAAPTTSTYDCRPYLNGNNETCSIATAQAGTYYVMVRGYSAYSAASLVGDYSTGGGGGGGFTETNLSGASGSWKDFQLVVPAGMSKLEVKMSGGSGDADLYLRRGSNPTTSAYDCRPYLNGNTETCTVNSPTAATYYIRIRGYSAYSGVTLDARYYP
jgi:serine protease